MPTETSLLSEMAYALGTHALAAFVLTLVLLCWTVAGAWGFSRHYWIPRIRTSMPPGLLLAVHLVFGFALVVLAALAFGLLAMGIGDGGTVAQLDTVLTNAIRASTGPRTLQAFALITHFGDSATLLTLGLVVAIVLPLLGREWLVLPWVAALLGNALLGALLKSLFARARPLFDHSLTYTHGWSFPSGHASGAVVAYGMLAYLLLRVMPGRWMAVAGLPVVLAATGIAFATASSRVFLQVHYASDVLAGCASGLAWLLVCIAGVELTRHAIRVRNA